MPNTLASYSPQRCRTLLSRMAVPLGGLVALVAAAAWLTPTALEINPSRWPAVVTLIIMVIGATLWFGPFMVNLGGGALRATSFLRTDGPWLLIGNPFTRRVRLTDIETVTTRHAEGDVFEVIIDVHPGGGHDVFSRRCRRPRCGRSCSGNPDTSGSPAILLRSADRRSESALGR